MMNSITYIAIAVSLLVTSPGMERIRKESTFDDVRKMYAGHEITFDTTTDRWSIHNVEGYGRMGRLELDTNDTGLGLIRWVDETPINSYPSYDEYNEALVESLNIVYGPEDVEGIHAWISDSGIVSYTKTYGFAARVWWRPGPRSDRTLEESLEMLINGSLKP